MSSLLSYSDNYSSQLHLDFNDHYLTSNKSCSLVASILSSNLPIVSLDMGDGYNVGIYTTLCNSLHHNNMLKELYLDRKNLQPEHMQLLGQVLSNNSTLSVLDISYNNIGPHECQHLANVRNTSLSELIMRRCGVGVDGADHIGKMLLHNESIRSVNLDGNNIKDGGVKMLVEHLMSIATFKQLDLGDNDITSIGAGYLANLFACNTCTVNDIRLDVNPLEDE